MSSRRHERILVTGGAGYVGRHVALALLEAGHTVHLLDNLATSSLAQVRELEELVQELITLTSYLQKKIILLL